MFLLRVLGRLEILLLRPRRAPGRLAIGAALLWLSPGLAAQNVRAPVRVDTSTQLGAAGAAPAVSGDRALVVYNHDAEVTAVRSSDRGQSWSAPLRVDTDASGAFKWSGRNGDRLPLALFGTRGHVLWRDARLGADDLWYARTTDGGASFAVERRLDPGFGPGTAPVRDFAFLAVPSGTTEHLHVLFTLEPGSLGPDEVRLITSLDGGLTFRAARPAASVAGNGIDVDQVAIAAVGNVVHCAWVDDRSGTDDVYYRRSTDGGVSFAGAELALDASGPGFGDAQDALCVAAEGNLVAVAWLEDLATSLEELHVAVSKDGGLTFGPDRRVGQALPGLDDVDGCTLAVQNGYVMVAWSDDRTGVDTVYVTRSNDQGASYVPEFALSAGGGSEPHLATSADIVSVTWVGGGTPGVDEEAYTRTSRDAGATWSVPVPLSAQSGDVDFAEPALDPVYGNLVIAWLADDLLGANRNDVWTGGVRPQTQVPVGWVGGPTTARFDFRGFSGTAPFVWVLGSDAPGGFVPGVFGDVRSTGLTLDSTLLFTLQFPTLFTGTLNASGTGSTVPFALNLPVGTRLYTMAISFTFAPAALAEFTDVIVLQL